jgi:hypothetical protein
MGFHPLANKVFLTRCKPLGLLRYILAASASRPLDEGRIAFGRFGKFLVSSRPRPVQMHALATARDGDTNRLELLRDEAYNRWRYRNQRYRYVFYYLMEGDVALGYVVMGVSPNSQRANILDYAGGDGPEIGEILGYVIRAKHYDLVSIYTYGVDDRLHTTLDGLGFRLNSLVRVIERRMHGELPLLLRPVPKSYSESDFIVSGIDTRRIENWSLKPICSDAV